MSTLKWNQMYFAAVENDMPLCPNEREVQLKFCVHLFGRIRHSVLFFVLFSIIKFFTSEMHVSTDEIAP